MWWTEWTDNLFRGLDLRDLQVDEAFLNVTNAVANKKFCLYSLSEECVKCPFKKLRTISHGDTVIKLDVARNLKMRLFLQNESSPCADYVFPNKTSDGLVWSAEPEFGEFGVYDLQIKSSQAIMFATAKEPVYIYSCEYERFFLQLHIIFDFYSNCYQLCSSLQSFSSHSTGFAKVLTNIT